jgi:ubiquinone/menaquinone biosynthesis C-methylase UbiE
VTAKYQAPVGVEFWSGTVGASWAERQEDFDAVLAPIGHAAIARAAIRPGERIIDVGCGCGTTTIALARRTGPQGHVLGIDISKPMLSRAVERAEPGQSIEFVEADATTYTFPAGSYDVLFSRVGIMFFPDPILAFTNMRRALRSGGRISLACFRTPQESPYLMVPLSVDLRCQIPRQHDRLILARAAHAQELAVDALYGV